MRPHRAVLLALAATAALAASPAGQAQPVAVDTVLSWESYASTRRARVRLFPATDERRPLTVVVDERAENGGLATDEVRFFAETSGRALDFDPAAATFVFRFTAAAFTPGAPDGGRALLLRATFRRADSGELGPPTWRVITAEALEELTDRQFR